MSYFDIFRMALFAIFRNKVRSSLTALGIVIGVASVIAMVHLGEAATASVTNSISSMGSNLLIVSSGVNRGGPGGTRTASEPLTNSEVLAIKREMSYVTVAPTVRATETLVWSGANYPANVLGTENEFFEVRNWSVKTGRIFEPAEIRAGKTVCVVGSTIVDELFGDKEPLGETVRVGRTGCLVVGVMETKGAAMGEDLDAYLVMPMKAVQQRLRGNDDISQIYVSADTPSLVTRATAHLEMVLRQERNIPPNEEIDFSIRNMKEIADTLKGVTTTLTLLLGAIAAVSLLVGGIGVMNIMLVSVSERTREIGIRIAIGATSRDVLAQFIIEAITLSMLGGLVGIVLGISSTWLITSKMDLPFSLNPEVVLLGFGFSVFIGTVFGFLPARKAASLQPIEALRHE